MLHGVHSGSKSLIRSDTYSSKLNERATADPIDIRQLEIELIQTIVKKVETGFECLSFDAFAEGICRKFELTEANTQKARNCLANALNAVLEVPAYSIKILSWLDDKSLKSTGLEKEVIDPKEPPESILTAISKCQVKINNRLGNTSAPDAHKDLLGLIPQVAIVETVCNSSQPAPPLESQPATKGELSAVIGRLEMAESSCSLATQDLNEQVRSEVETQLKGFEEAIKAQNPKEISEFIETFKKDQEEKKAALERAKRDAAWNSVGNVASAVGHSFSAVQSFLSNKDIAKAQSKQGVKANRAKTDTLQTVLNLEPQSDSRTIFFNNLQYFEEGIKSGDDALEQIEILLSSIQEDINYELNAKGKVRGFGNRVVSSQRNIVQTYENIESQRLKLSLAYQKINLGATILQNGAEASPDAAVKAAGKSVGAVNSFLQLLGAGKVRTLGKAVAKSQKEIDRCQNIGLSAANLMHKREGNIHGLHQHKEELEHLKIAIFKSNPEAYGDEHIAILQKDISDDREELRNLEARLDGKKKEHAKQDLAVNAALQKKISKMQAQTNLKAGAGSKKRNKAQNSYDKATVHHREEELKQLAIEDEMDTIQRQIDAINGKGEVKGSISLKEEQINIVAGNKEAAIKVRNQRDLESKAQTAARISLEQADLADDYSRDAEDANNSGDHERAAKASRAAEEAAKISKQKAEEAQKFSEEAGTETAARIAEIALDASRSADSFKKTAAFHARAAEVAAPVRRYVKLEEDKWSLWLGFKRESSDPHFNIMQEGFATTCRGVDIAQDVLENSLRTGMELIAACDRAFGSNLLKNIPYAAPATIIKSAELYGNALKLESAFNGIGAMIKTKQAEEAFKDLAPFEILKALDGSDKMKTAMMLLGPVAQGAIILLELHSFLSEEEVEQFDPYMEGLRTLQEDMHQCFNALGEQLEKVDQRIKEGFESTREHLEFVKEEINAKLEEAHKKIEKALLDGRGEDHLLRIQLDLMKFEAEVLSPYVRYIQGDKTFAPKDDIDIGNIIESLQTKTTQMVLSQQNGNATSQLSMALINPAQTTGLLAYHKGGIGDCPDFYQYDHYAHVFCKLAIKLLSDGDATRCDEDRKEKLLALSEQLIQQGQSLELLFSEATLIEVFERYKNSQNALIAEIEGQVTNNHSLVPFSNQMAPSVSYDETFFQLNWITSSGFSKAIERSDKEPLSISSKANEKLYGDIFSRMGGSKVFYFFPNPIDASLLEERSYTLQKLSEELETRHLAEKSLLSIWEDKQFQRITPQERSEIRGNFIELAYRVDLKVRQINFCRFESREEMACRIASRMHKVSLDPEWIPADRRQQFRSRTKNPDSESKDKEIDLDRPIPPKRILKKEYYAGSDFGGASEHYEEVPHERETLRRLIKDIDKTISRLHSHAAFHLGCDKAPQEMETERNKELTEELNAHDFNTLFSFSVILSAKEQAADGLSGRTFVAISDDFNHQGLKRLQRQEDLETVEFDHRFYKKVKTSSDGACALHALRGNKVKGEYRLNGARELFVSKMTTELLRFAKLRISEMGINTSGFDKGFYTLKSREEDLKSVEKAIQQEFVAILKGAGRCRETSFVEKGEVQSIEEIELLTKRVAEGNDVLINESFECIKGKFKRPHQIFFGDFYQNKWITESELNKTLKTIHHELHQELKSKGLRLNIPYDQAEQVKWKRSEPDRFNSKTFEVKLREILSKLAAIKWIQDNIDRMNVFNSFNIRFERGERGNYQYLSLMPPNQRKLLRDILEGHLNRALEGKNPPSKMLFFDEVDIWNRAFETNASFRKKVLETSPQTESTTLRSLKHQEKQLWTNAFGGLATPENETLRKKIFELAPKLQGNHFKGLDEAAIQRKIEDDNFEGFGLGFEIINLDKDSFVSLLSEECKPRLLPLLKEQEKILSGEVLAKKIQQNPEAILEAIQLDYPGFIALLEEDQKVLFNVGSSSEPLRERLDLPKKVLNKWEALKEEEKSLSEEAKNAWISLWKEQRKLYRSESELLNKKFLEKIIELAPKTGLGPNKEAIISALDRRPERIMGIVNEDDSVFKVLTPKDRTLLELKERIDTNAKAQEDFINSPEVFERYLKVVSHEPRLGEKPFWFNTKELELAAHLFKKKAQVIKVEDGKQTFDSLEPFNKELDLPGETVVIHFNGSDHFSRCEPLEAITKTTTDTYVNSLYKIATTPVHSLAVKELVEDYQEFLDVTFQSKEGFEKGLDLENKYTVAKNPFDPLNKTYTDFDKATLLASRNENQCPLAFPKVLLDYIETSVAPKGIRRSNVPITLSYSFLLNQRTNCYELAIDYQLRMKGEQKNYLKFVVAQFGSETVDAFRSKNFSPKKDEKDSSCDSAFLIQAMYGNDLPIPGEGSFRLIHSSATTVIPINLLAIADKDTRIIDRVDHALPQSSSALVENLHKMITQSHEEDFFLANKQYHENLRKSIESIQGKGVYKKAEESFLLLKAILKLTLNPKALSHVNILDPKSIARAESSFIWKEWEPEKVLNVLRSGYHAFQKTEERSRLETQLKNLELIYRLSKMKRFDDSGNALVQILEFGSPFSDYNPLAKKSKKLGPSNSSNRKGKPQKLQPPKATGIDRSQSESSLKQEPIILPTVADGNCLIHAIFGGASPRGIYSPDARLYRDIVAEQIFEYEKENNDPQNPQKTCVVDLRSFESGNVVSQEPRNIVQMGETLKLNREWLGLEHADLIAKLNGLNILAYNEQSKEFVPLFHNKDPREPVHIISFFREVVDGIEVGHWSRCLLNTHL